MNKSDKTGGGDPQVGDQSEMSPGDSHSAEASSGDFGSLVPDYPTLLEEKIVLDKNLLEMNASIAVLAAERKQEMPPRTIARSALTRAQKTGVIEDITTAQAALTPLEASLAPKEKKLKELEKAYKEQLSYKKDLDKRVENAGRTLNLDGVDEKEYPQYAASLAATLEVELQLFDEDILKDAKDSYATTWFTEVPSRSEVGGFSCGDRVKEHLGATGEIDVKSEVPLGFARAASTTAGAGANPDDGGGHDSEEGSQEVDSKPKKLDHKLFEWFFCMVHCGFEPRSATDMDHASPYEEVRRNQQRLLDFLNANSVFIQHLIAAPGMNKYFQINDAGLVEVSKLFLAKGYNAINNLWLLCHVCNLNKSASEPMKFFTDKIAFGYAFKQAVDAAGSFHPGVLIGRIYKCPPLSEGPEEGLFNLSTVDGSNINLYTGEGSELGEFVTQWFMENRSEIYTAAETFQIGIFESFRKRLSDILQVDDEQERKVMTRQFQNAFSILAGVYKQKSDSLKVALDSSSDNTEVREYRDSIPEIVVRLISYLELSAAVVKKIGKRLKHHFGERKTNIWAPMYEHLVSSGSNVSPVKLNELLVSVELVMIKSTGLEEKEASVNKLFEEFISSQRASSRVRQDDYSSPASSFSGGGGRGLGDDLNFDAESAFATNFFLVPPNLGHNDSGEPADVALGESSQDGDSESPPRKKMSSRESEVGADSSRPTWASDSSQLSEKVASQLTEIAEGIKSVLGGIPDGESKAKIEAHVFQLTQLVQTMSSQFSSAPEEDASASAAMDPRDKGGSPTSF